MNETRKFIRTIEDFTCEQCGTEVKGNGYTNHCPHCLWSKHVDNNPGDRTADCQGMMEPIGLLVTGSDWIIVQRCQKCGKIMKIKADEADNREELVVLSAKILPNIK